MRGPDRGARVVGQLRQARDGAEGRVVGRRAPSVWIAATRTASSGSSRQASAAPTAVGGPPSAPIASSAATRTVGSGSSSTTAMSAGPAASTEVRPSRSAAIRRMLGSGAAERLDQRGDDARVRGQRAQARSALEDLLAEPRPQRPEQAGGIAATDAEHDERAQRARSAPRARRPGRAARRVPAARMRSPDSTVPIWPGTPSLKASTCARRSVGTHVVERAPGRVRQPALGHLLA